MNTTRILMVDATHPGVSFLPASLVLAAIPARSSIGSFGSYMILSFMPYLAYHPYT